MSLTDEKGISLINDVLTGILVALVGWLTTSIVTYFLRRNRLRAALLTDITLNVQGARLQVAAVGTLMEHVTAGKRLPFPIHYSVGEYLLYKSVQSDLPSYLFKDELIKVVQFYQFLWDLDVSIRGLALTLGQWEKENIELSPEQVAHAATRKARIDSLCQVLPDVQALSRLTDLPTAAEYAMVKAPGTVVDDTSGSSKEGRENRSAGIRK